jgi:hypothetical protein
MIDMDAITITIVTTIATTAMAGATIAMVGVTDTDDIVTIATISGEIARPITSLPLQLI